MWWHFRKTGHCSLLLCYLCQTTNCTAASLENGKAIWAKKTESSRALQGNCLSPSQQCLERLQPGNISHQNTHWFSRKRVTWSVWGVSVCPGPGWGWVWRSPEENDLGSASPGTPYRFAWQTDGGRGGGGRRGLPSVSNTTVATCVFFLLFLTPPLLMFFFFFTPILIISDQPTLKCVPRNIWRNQQQKVQCRRGGKSETLA